MVIRINTILPPLIYYESVVDVAFPFFILPNYFQNRFSIDLKPYISFKGSRIYKIVKIDTIQICTYYFREFTHVIISTNLSM